MTEVLDAIFEHGVFRPLASPGLSEGQRVHLRVEPVAETTADELLRLAEGVYEGLSPSEVDEVERLALRRRQLFLRAEA